MALIEGFRVQNYRALRDVTLGKLSNQQHGEPLTPLTVVIGKNGAGKSTLFDAFGFVADCLLHDDSYDQDSVCGTWELLADALYPGGSKAVQKAGWPLPGQLKHEWAGRIAPCMDVQANDSPSFRKFRDGLRRLARLPTVGR